MCSSRDETYSRAKYSLREPGHRGLDRGCGREAAARLEAVDGAGEGRVEEWRKPPLLAYEGVGVELDMVDLQRSKLRGSCIEVPSMRDEMECLSDSRAIDDMLGLCLRPLLGRNGN